MSQFENPYYQNGGGGGYLAGNSPFGSANGSPSGGVRRTEASHSLRPLTIAQLSKATQAHTDAEWMLENVELGQVTVVAQVTSIQSQTTNCVYHLHDGTGAIEARHWIDSSNANDVNQWGEINDVSVIRVTGTLKTFGSKRYINATRLRLSADPHELYFHILECITTTLIFEKGHPNGSGSGQQTNGAVVGNGNTAYTTQSPSGAGNDEFAHLQPLQRSIINFILAQPPIDEGIHVAAIARAVGGDAHLISDALDKLMDEGHVFSTIDESHFNVSR